MQLTMRGQPVAARDSRDVDEKELRDVNEKELRQADEQTHAETV